MYLNFRAGKNFDLPGPLDLEVAFQVFNPFNWDHHQQYTYNGANQEFSSNYLQPRNRQLARAYQLVAAVRFQSS
ncbi:MAG: hypothetical protein GY856_28945 [bacterium]|nr:hypothetical protein [bacterium]